MILAVEYWILIATGVCLLLIIAVALRHYHIFEREMAPPTSSIASADKGWQKLTSTKRSKDPTADEILAQIRHGT